MAVTKVVMPRLSEQMETGKIIKWLKREGDRVQSGDILAEVETDKADVEMEAFGAGVLRKILMPAGSTAPVGSLIGVIAEPGEDISALDRPGGPEMASRPAAVPPQPRREDPAARTPAPAAGPDRPGVSATAPGPPQPARPAAPAAAPAAPAAGDAPGRVKASPLARKIAAQSGVDLRLLQGSGPGGRVVRRDVEAAATSAAAAPAAPRPAVAPGVEFEDRPLSQMRAVIAKRMPLAKAPVPHFYVTSEIAMDRVWALREELNGLEGQPKISINDFVVRACALALLDHPGVNAAFQGESIRVFHRAHIGIAVALEEGLITPVLRDADAKSLARIAVEARDLAERARARKLRAPEMSGATFSISNLGMFDVAEFSAIINPPEGAILAVGSVRTVPVVTEAGLGVGRRMMLTISCDHRVMDGAMGARFLQDVKRRLEEPLRLLV
ncbi:MAG TPA: dihydrolipoamide acetyltransferase family protein [Methylomirabilota bacterium]|nr:dihydrolipoamide acetyltransferase family protein [Methylomirabilota bacterium]